MNLTLPPLLDHDLGEYKDELLQLLPRFFIPRLQDKPQDPIMDALRIERESKTFRHEESPPKLVITGVKAQESPQDFLGDDPTFFWERAAKEGVRFQVSLLLN
jgi:hypothetical protein